MEIQNEIKKAINLFQKGDYDQARKIYEEILKDKPELVEIHYNLGIILKASDKLADAEKSFNKAQRH